MGKNIKDYTFIDHIEEFRYRIIKILIIFVLILILSLFFIPNILNIIKMPIKNIDINLNVFSFEEYFFSYLKIGFITSLVITFPIIVSQISAFVLPALHKSEKKLFYFTVFSSIILFLLGLIFSYFVLTPISFNFLYNFAKNSENYGFLDRNIIILPGLNQYISLFLLLIFITGVSFQLPLIVCFLTKIGILNDKTLIKYRAHSLVIIFLVSAFITPPDIITQFILGIPMYLLFEISILLSKILGKKLKYL